MKASIVQESFSKALGMVGRIVPSRGQLPVLGNVLIEGGKEGLWLTVTNLEIGLRILAGGKVLEEGAVTIPAKNLAEYVASLPGGQVNLDAGADKLVVTAGKSNATFAGIAASEFPVIPRYGEGKSKNEVTSIGKQVIGQIAAQVAFAAAGEESRPVLTGVQIRRSGDVMQVTATDGFRLSKKKVKIEKGEEGDKGLILPARTMVELARLVGEGRKESVHMEMVTENNQVVFDYDGMQLISRILEGNYPDVEKIIPGEFSTEVMVDKSELERGIRAEAIFARDNSNIVRIRVGEDKIFIEASASQTGESVVEIEAETKGEEMVIAFNYRYLLDYLGSVEEDRVKMKLNGSLSPGVFVEMNEGEEVDRVYLVMPVRI